jgi:hypothetical protein
MVLQFVDTLVKRKALLSLSHRDMETRGMNMPEEEKQFTREDWNDWTDEVREYMETVQEHLPAYLSAEEGRTESAFNRRIRQITAALEDGDEEDTMMKESKETIHKFGKSLPLWPKRRGKATTFSGWANDMVTYITDQWAECWTAYYNAAVERGIAHHIMTRASKKNGTPGVSVGSLENFLKGKRTATKSAYKSDFKNGLWGEFNTDINADQPEGTVAEWVLAPLSRPVSEEAANDTTEESA